MQMETNSIGCFEWMVFARQNIPHQNELWQCARRSLSLLVNLPHWKNYFREWVRCVQIHYVVGNNCNQNPLNNI